MYSIPENLGLAAIELEDGRLKPPAPFTKRLWRLARRSGRPWTCGIRGAVSVGYSSSKETFNGAVQLCRKSLIVFRRVGRRGGAAFAIFKLACCAARLGECFLAAQLIGAHDTFEIRINGAVPEKAYKWSPLRLAVDDSLVRLHHVLGEVEFERAYAQVGC